MSKIIIIGDVHFGDGVPSRKDDYPTSILNQLYVFCEANQDSDIICLGDFFNLLTVNFRNLGNFYNILQLIRDKFGCKFHSIIGNHDCGNQLDDEDSMVNTPLGYFSRIGLIDMMLPNSSLCLGNNIFHSSYVNKGKCIKDLENYQDNYCMGNKSFNQFLLLHHSDIDKELLDSIPVNAIFLGHEHCPYSDTTLINSRKNNIYLPGSFTRKEALDFNFNDNRCINYYEISDGDVILKKFNYIKEAKDVFKVNALERTNYKINQYKKTVKEIANKMDINDIISKYDKINNCNKVYSIKDALKELKTPDVIYDAIVKEYSEVQ